MPPNPPSNAHGFAMRSMSLCDMQIPKSEKKISWPPPLPNPGDAPEVSFSFILVPLPSFSWEPISLTPAKVFSVYTRVTCTAGERQFTDLTEGIFYTIQVVI